MCLNSALGCEQQSGMVPLAGMTAAKGIPPAPWQRPECAQHDCPPQASFAEGRCRPESIRCDEDVMLSDLERPKELEPIFTGAGPSPQALAWSLLLAQLQHNSHTRLVAQNVCSFDVHKVLAA